MEARSAFERAPDSLLAGHTAYLKREDAHETGVFKWRATLAVLSAYRERGDTSVVTASTGNHGAATAWAAREVGMAAIVYVPVGASRRKLELLAGFGAELREAGADLDAAKDEGGRAAAAAGVPVFGGGGGAIQ